MSRTKRQVGVVVDFLSGLIVRMFSHRVQTKQKTIRSRKPGEAVHRDRTQESAQEEQVVASYNVGTKLGTYN